MDRLVHHELRSSLTALLAVVVGAVVVGLVRGLPSTRITDGTALFIAAVFGLLVLFTLLKATRITWFSGVPEWDAATPVDPETALPTQDFRHAKPVDPVLLLILLVPALFVALVWQPWMIVTPLWSAVEWAGQAALIACWERRNGRQLWRGRVQGRPGELSYSPVSPPAPTRTATDAPPA
ncbi:hypothetical protein [Streptomyces sp. NPDC050287]|uniref:hypothetical protein n=1 Tax=Streptomyces sp. NPDC050287 TaxID=3365608 RepID=UPI0037A60695